MSEKVDQAKVQSELDDLLRRQEELRAFYEADWDPDNDVMGVPVPSLREARIMYATTDQLREWVVRSLATVSEMAQSDATANEPKDGNAVINRMKLRKAAEMQKAEMQLESASPSKKLN